MGLAQIYVDAVACAAALPNQWRQSSGGDGDAHTGGVGDAPARLLLSTDQPLGLDNAADGDGLALPAVETKDAVRFRDHLPAFEVVDLRSALLALTDVGPIEAGGPLVSPDGLTSRKSCRAAPRAMAVSPYRVTPARIGNSSGLRLPAAFYRDHPQFAGAAGQVEVLNDNTLLLRLEPEEQQQQGEAEEDSLMLGLFLDFLSRQALTADQGPVLYTEAMAADDDELLAGVTVEAAEEPLGV